MEILAEIITRRYELEPGPTLERFHDDFLKQLEEISDDDTDEDFSGWYCIETDDWPCPQCGTIVKFATAQHKIIVWDEKDHPAMLKIAQACQKVNRNPRIVEYEESFGPAVSWYTFDAHDEWAAHWQT